MSSSARARRLVAVLALVLLVSFRAWVYLNVGSLFLIRGDDPRARYFLTLAAGESGTAEAATVHLWTLDAALGRCETPTQLLRILIAAPGGFDRLAVRARDNLSLQACLWSLARAAERTDLAIGLETDIQFPRSSVFEDQGLRAHALSALPTLVRSGLWTAGFARRVLHYARGFAAIEEGALIQDAEGRLRATQPARSIALAQSDSLDAACPTGEDVASARGSGRVSAWATALDEGLTRWDFNTGWVGGEVFWPALFMWQHDRVMKVEGKASFHLTGFWSRPVEGRQSPRAGMALRVPPLPGGPANLNLAYRTDGLQSGDAFVMLTRADQVTAQWPLPQSPDCWRRLNVSVDWPAASRTELLIMIAANGEVWVDDLRLETATRR